MPDNITRMYRIGGVHFRLVAPAHAENPWLAPFAVPDNSWELTPDVTYTVHIVSGSPLPDGKMLSNGKPLSDQTPVFTDGFRMYYKTGDDSGTTVFLDEVTHRCYMTDTFCGREHEVWLDASHADFLPLLSLRLMDLPGQLLRQGGAFLHASFIAVHGEAILFTAQKQVGKSTQAHLWETYRGATVVNGDRAILRQADDGRWYAWGSPFCGTSGISRAGGYPLKCIVILSQGKTNTVARAGARQAFIALMDGCTYDTWDRVEVDAVTGLCDRLIPAVPFYTLSCVPDESAVRALEAVL